MCASVCVRFGVVVVIKVVVLFVGGDVAMVASWSEMAYQWARWGRQAGRDSYWVLIRMMMTNDKLSFMASGCCARLPAGAGDMVLGGHCCVLGHIILVVGSGQLVYIVGAMGDIIWLPRCCGQCGTWWVLIHLVTWGGRFVLEQ